MARRSTRPAYGTVNYRNDLDPRDVPAARGKTVKYSQATYGRAWREEVKKIEREMDKGTHIQMAIVCIQTQIICQIKSQ